jgi:hypothetical protein
LKLQKIVVVFCLASRPYNLLEVFYLVYIIYHSTNLLELFDSIEDVESLKDVIFIQFIHDFEEYVLVRSYNSFGNLVVSIEESFNDLNDVVNCMLIPLQKSNSKRSKAIIERKSIE